MAQCLPAKLKRTERRRKIMQMVLAGKPYTQIAEIMGVSKDTIGKDVKIALHELAVQQADITAKAREVEIARLDSALNACWDRVIEGDNQAIETYLKIADRRIKIMGLEAASKLIVEQQLQCEVVGILEVVKNTLGLDAYKQVLTTIATSTPLMLENDNITDTD